MSPCFQLCDFLFVKSLELLDLKLKLKELKKKTKILTNLRKCKLQSIFWRN